MMPGFPRASATWCCGAALYYDIDAADTKQEALMPCVAECLEFSAPQIHRCYDAIWAIKSGGVNAAYFPVTLKGHPCCPLAVGDIDSDGKPEIVVGSDINPPEGPRNPDARVYAFNCDDGSWVAGFPRDLVRGPISGGICLVNLDSSSQGSAGAAESLFGTRGHLEGNKSSPGLIAALNGDATIRWTYDTGDFQVLNAPAVGNLLDGSGFEGEELVFVVERFDVLKSYKKESRLIVLSRTGSLLGTYDLGDTLSDENNVMSSPAIGKIKSSYESDPNNHIASNIVVSARRGGTEEDPTCGPISIFHLAPTSGTIVCDWSYRADVQTCDGRPETFTADPAVGDIDGDGQNEIVAFSDYGTIYVVDYDGQAFSVTSATVSSCGFVHFHASSPLLFDVDDRHDTLEIIVGTSPNWRCPGATSPSVVVYSYDQSNGLRKIYDIGPFEERISGTPALGDLDDDGHTDMIVQPVIGGQIYCFEFTESTYPPTTATIYKAAWPAKGKNAARTHCAD